MNNGCRPISPHTYQSQQHLGATRSYPNFFKVSESPTTDYDSILKHTRPYPPWLPALGALGPDLEGGDNLGEAKCAAPRCRGAPSSDPLGSILSH